MNTTAYLTVSSLKMFIRNKQAVFFTLFVPIIIMSVFGVIGFDRVPKINVGIVVSSPTPATQEFITRLKDVSAFEVAEGSAESEQEALSKGDRAVVLMIPDSLIPTPDRAGAIPEKQTIRALTNVGEQQQAQTAMTILSQLLDKTTLAIAQAPALFEIQTEEVNARNVRYIDFLLPGIVALAVMQMSTFSVAFVFVDYKEKGILKRLLATPMKPYQFITANIVTRLIAALAQTIILIALGILIFKSQVIGSYPLMLLIAALGGMMFLGLGFTISGIAKTVDAVPAIANLIVFPMMFLGGVFFPTDSMPDWLQRVVQYLPLTYFSHALREVMARGSTITQIAPDIYAMIAWAVALLVLANISFSFEEKRAG